MEHHLAAAESGDDKHREPLLTDVLTILVGLMFIAIGYLKSIENNIPYAPGDYRLTTGYHQVMFSLGLIIGVFLSVFGSIRLVMGLRRRRH